MPIETTESDTNGPNITETVNNLQQYLNMPGQMDNIHVKLPWKNFKHIHHSRGHRRYFNIM
jgi:hypothetical protein